VRLSSKVLAIGFLTVAEAGLLFKQLQPTGEIPNSVYAPG